MDGWQQVAEEATAKLHVQHAEIKRLKAELAEIEAEFAAYKLDVHVYYTGLLSAAEEVS